MPASVTPDHFLDGRLVIRQPADGYRAGSDPIFLAAAVQAKAGEKVLDVGCGVGTASLCLLRRYPDVQVTGLDIQAELLELCRDNIQRNALDHAMQVVEGSVDAPPSEVPYHHYHHVITNPPWYPPGSIRPPAALSKALGHMEDVSLGQWLSQSVRFLRPRGRISVVHRADRLADILAALSVLQVGEIRIMPLWPKAGRPATRVVVCARKDVKSPMELSPGIILHRADGSYGEKAEDILRHGADLWST